MQLPCSQTAVDASKSDSKPSLTAKSLFSAVLGAAVLFGCLLTAFSPTNLRAPLNPIDEGAHVDYAIHLASGNLLKWNTKVDQATMRIVECTESTTSTSPPTSERCAKMQRNPLSFPVKGYSYEAQQPPLAYIPYALLWNLASVAKKPPQDQLKYLRFTNIGWALLSSIFLGLILFELRLGTWANLATAFMLGMNPAVTQVLSYVTNDASALTVGLVAVFLFLLLLNSDHREASSKWIIVTSYIVYGAVMGLTKEFFLVLPLALLLTILLYPRKLNNLRFLLLVQFLQLFVAILATLIYQFITQARSTIPSSVIQSYLLGPFRGRGFPIENILHALTTWTAFFSTGNNPIGNLIEFVFGGLVVTAALYPVSKASGDLVLTSRLWSGAALAAGIVGVASCVMFWRMGNYDMVFSLRVVLCVLPMFLVPVALKLEEFKILGVFISILGCLAIGFAITT
jgi:hypothetical protein